MRDVLDPRRYPWIAFQLFSHKMLRWAVPLLLGLLLLANIALAQADFYAVTLIGQLFFYFLAALGWVCGRLGCEVPLLSMPYHFVLGNIAVMRAFAQFVRGDRQTGWRPSR
jgi:hypothetical protein